MSELKEQLTAMVEAYATARATGNEILVNGAGATLLQFLESVEIVKLEAAADPEPQED